jgi:hypothetical protein
VCGVVCGPLCVVCVLQPCVVFVGLSSFPVRDYVYICLCVCVSAGRLLQRMMNVHQSFVFMVRCRRDGLEFASAAGDHSIGACVSVC